MFDIRRLKPLDAEFLDEALRRYPMVAVAEENYLAGGVGEALAARIAEGGYTTLLRCFGVLGGQPTCGAGVLCRHGLPP